MTRKRKKTPQKINLNDLRLKTRKTFERNPVTQVVPNRKKKNRSARKQMLRKMLREDDY